MTARKLASGIMLAGMLIAMVGSAPAEPLGRLFLTPERRAALERQRQLNLPDTRMLEGSRISLDGVVIRSGGQSTVWVNQRPQNENSPGSGVTVAVSPKRPDRAVLTPDNEAPASLKVGESMNRGTREKNDVVNEGAIRIHPTIVRDGKVQR